MKFTVLSLGMVCLSVCRVSAQDLTEPAAVLAKCRAAYADCTTCTVEGQLRSDFKTVVPRTVTKDVRILFARPDSLFRLDWTETENGGERQTNSVFTRGGRTYFFWGSLGRFEQPEDLQMALAGATGISSGLAYFLPQMLLRQSGPLDFTKPAFRPEETLNGRPCYVVTGKAGRGDRPSEAAIDKETFAVVRFKETAHIKSQSPREAAARMKKIDPKLAAEIAARPPTPDFDVDSVTDYHTTFGAPVTAPECDYPVPAGMKLSEER